VVDDSADVDEGSAVVVVVIDDVVSVITEESSEVEIIGKVVISVETIEEGCEEVVVGKDVDEEGFLPKEKQE
jgi:hypothetical protein